MLIRFYNRDAAKDCQEGHQVSHIPLQDRYTFNYISNTQTTTTTTTTNKKKTSLVKIKSSLNNKANKQYKFNQKNKITDVRQQKQNIKKKLERCKSVLTAQSKKQQKQNK